MNFKPNAIGVSMLPIPFAFPLSPVPPRLQMDEFFAVGVSLKRPVARTQIGIGQGQRWNRLTAMGTLDVRAKNGMLQGWVDH